MRLSICSQALPAVLVLPALLPALGWSATLCSQHFAVGAAPVITNPKLQPRTREVCFETFAVLHSGLSRKKNRDDAHRPQRSDRDAVLLPAGEGDGGYTLKDLSRSVMEAIRRAGR